jgi:hypothetical protein
LTRAQNIAALFLPNNARLAIVPASQAQWMNDKSPALQSLPSKFIFCKVCTLIENEIGFTNFILPLENYKH